MRDDENMILLAAFQVDGGSSAGGGIKQVMARKDFLSSFGTQGLSLYFMQGVAAVRIPVKSYRLKMLREREFSGRPVRGWVINMGP